MALSPKPLVRLLFIGLLLLGSLTALRPLQAEPLTVAYFMEWPTPSQFAQTQKLYDEVLGVEVRWVAFDAGTAMSAAMASGDVQIAFSQGVPPFVVAASTGQDLQIVDIAVSYSENENCVVHSSLEITNEDASELEGLKVGVPIGTAAHYGFLKQMEHLGVDTTTMSIVDMAPPDGAVAFATGSLDMVCGWGGALRRMKEYGNVLLTGAEKEAVGIQVFDATTVSTEWAEANPELLADFLRVTAQMNARYAKDGAEEMLPVIAKAAGMEQSAARESLATFVFPSIEEQLGPRWLGGGTQRFLKEVADFFVAQGIIPEARDSYQGAVDARYLRIAAEN